MKTLTAAGITLVEMLVTAAIISVLMMVAVPKFMLVLHKAQVSKAVAEVRSVCDAVEEYRLHHAGALPNQMADLVPGCLAVAPIDPWGEPYVFGRFGVIPPGARRKDGTGGVFGLINQEFDLYSKGKDGITNANIRNPECRDDIIMANDGGFIGLPSAY